MGTATTTATVTVNAAFFQEIKDASSELWQLLARLRHAFSRPISPGVACRRYVEWLSELRDQLAVYFSLEEFYGYFEEPLAVAPHLCDRADALRNEHGDLYRELCDIIDSAEQLLYDGKYATLITQISQSFVDFDYRLKEHEAREADLILQMFDEDLGVGD
jgi:hypothetical protein